MASITQSLVPTTKRFSIASITSAFARSTATTTSSPSRPSWSIPCTPSSSKTVEVPTTSDSAQSTTEVLSPTSTASTYASTLSTPWYLPAIPLLDSLAELFPPLLWAVPKHKVTHSRKSMRSANKGLKNKTNFSHCEGCGQIKLAHNICPNCYSQISRRWKKEARGEVGLSGRDASSSGPSASA